MDNNPTNSAPTFVVGDGKVTVALEQNWYSGPSLVLPDGKVLLTSVRSLNSSYELAIRRFNPDGSTDTSFANNVNCPGF